MNEAYEESAAMLTVLQTIIKIFQLAWPEKIGLLRKKMACFKTMFLDSMQSEACNQNETNFKTNLIFIFVIISSV
jgi:hypothetical protein